MTSFIFYLDLYPTVVCNPTTCVLDHQRTTGKDFTFIYIYTTGIYLLRLKLSSSFCPEVWSKEFVTLPLTPQHKRTQFPLFTVRVLTRLQKESRFVSILVLKETRTRTWRKLSMRDLPSEIPTTFVLSQRRPFSRPIPTDSNRLTVECISTQRYLRHSIENTNDIRLIRRELSQVRPIATRNLKGRTRSLNHDVDILMQKDRTLSQGAPK